MKKQLIRISTLTFLLVSLSYLSINAQQYIRINAVYESEEVIIEHFFVTNGTESNKYSER